MRKPPLLSLLMLSVSLTAQSLTVPVGATARDGRGVVDVVSLERKGRLQILIGPQHLTASLGRSLTALRFRRDGAQFDLRGGTLAMTVRAWAATDLDPNAPSPRFADNHRNGEVVVFQGNVIAPTSGRLGHRDAATWSAADVVEIPFTTPFAYAGGTLCVELDMVPTLSNSPRWWPIDGERGTPGIVTRRGVACGALGQQAPEPASVDARSLRVGNTATFTTLGLPGSIAVLMLSPQTMGPIDLGFVGAPGCSLYLTPEVSLSTTIGAAIVTGRPGVAAISLGLPNQGQFLSAQLHAQWLLIHNLTLATTNVVDLQIAPTASSLDAAVVGATALSQAVPAVGRVELMLPVLQIDFR